MILLTILVLCVIVYLYSLRCLDAPISSGMRTGLMVCRLVFLGLLLVLMTNPQIREMLQMTTAPTLYIALDDSKSMSFPIDPSQSSNEDLSRWQQTLDRLQSDGLLDEWESEGFHTRFMVFSDAFQARGDSSTWSSQIPRNATPAFHLTDLSSVIDFFEDSHKSQAASYLLLFTDGRWNYGNNPVATADGVLSAAQEEGQIANQRIYTFGLGSTQETADLIVDHVVLPEQARSDESIPLRAHVIARGMTPSGTYPLEIRGESQDDEEVFYDEVDFTFNPDTQEATVETDLPSLPEGQYIFTVRVPPLQEELFTDNNRIRRGIQVREAKDDILLLTSAPDWEFKFMKRAFEEQDHLLVAPFLVHQNGLSLLGDRNWVERHLQDSSEEEFEEIPDFESLQEIGLRLDRWAVVVLHNFHLDMERVEFSQSLREYVENGGGVLLVPGPMNENPYSPQLQDILPAPIRQTYRPAMQPVQVVTEDNEYSSVFRRNSDGNLPPLNPYFQSGSQSITGRTLLTGISSTNEELPLLVEHRFGLGRILTTRANTFWRWRMMVDNDIVTPFWLKTLYQCKPGLRTNEAQLFTNKYLYEEYETVEVNYVASPEVSNSTLAGVPVTIQGPDRSHSLWLSPEEHGANRFRERFTPTQTGTYRIESRIDESTTTFQVEANLLESYQLSQNVRDLRSIAQSTGGEYANFPAWDELADNLPVSSLVREEMQSRFLGEKWWIAVILFFFLILEWYMRWLKGLP